MMGTQESVIKQSNRAEERAGQIKRLKSTACKAFRVYVISALNFKIHNFDVIEMNLNMERSDSISNISCPRFRGCYESPTKRYETFEKAFSKGLK